MKKFSKLAAILAVCAFIFGGLLVSCSPHGTGYGLDDGQSAGSGGAGGAGGGSGGGSGNPGDGGGSGGGEPTMYTVTVSSSIEHGRVSVDKTSAEAGATVKLTAIADGGYELDSYSVKDASANELTVTNGTFTMPKSNVTVSATFKETAYAKRTHSGIYTESSAYYINVDSQSAPSDGNGAW